MHADCRGVFYNGVGSGLRIEAIPSCHVLSSLTSCTLAETVYKRFQFMGTLSPDPKHQTLHIGWPLGPLPALILLNSTPFKTFLVFF